MLRVTGVPRVPPCQSKVLLSSIRAPVKPLGAIRLWPSPANWQPLRRFGQNSPIWGGELIGISVCCDCRLAGFCLLRPQQWPNRRSPLLKNKSGPVRRRNEVKYIMSGFSAFLLMGVVLLLLAEARCWWNGWRWVCGYHGSRGLWQLQSGALLASSRVSASVGSIKQPIAAGWRASIGQH